MDRARLVVPCGPALRARRLRGARVGGGVMPRPWIPIGYLPTRPSSSVPHGHEVVAEPGLDGDPKVVLLLIEGREYRVHREDGHWLVSIR